MRQTMRPLLVAVALLAAVVAVAALGAGAVAAQEDGQNPLSGFDGDDADDVDAVDEENRSILGRVAAGISRARSSVTRTLAATEGSSKRFFGKAMTNPFAEGPTNADHAASCQQAVRTNSDDLVEGINAHTDPDTDWNTTRVVFTGAEGDDAVIYALIDLDENGTGAQDLRVANTTDREVDHTVVLEDLAAEDCGEIVATVAEPLREGDDPLDEIDRAKMVGKYCSTSKMLLGGSPAEACDVSATFWLDESELPEYDISE